LFCNKQIFNYLKAVNYSK